MNNWSILVDYQIDGYKKNGYLETEKNENINKKPKTETFQQCTRPVSSFIGISIPFQFSIIFVLLFLHNYELVCILQRKITNTPNHLQCLLMLHSLFFMVSNEMDFIV